MSWARSGPPQGFLKSVVLLALFWRHPVPRWPIFHQILRRAWSSAMPKETSRSLILDYTAQNIFFAVCVQHTWSWPPTPCWSMIIAALPWHCQCANYFHGLAYINLQYIYTRQCWIHFDQGSDWKFVCMLVEASAHCRIASHQRSIKHQPPAAVAKVSPCNRHRSVPGEPVTCAARPPPQGNSFRFWKPPGIHMSPETSHHKHRNKTGALIYRIRDPPPPKQLEMFSRQPSKS